MSPLVKLLSSQPDQPWQAFQNKLMGFNIIYTTLDFPASLDGNKDLATHDQLLASGKLGLVNLHRRVYRMVDFAPGNEPLMH